MPYFLDRQFYHAAYAEWAPYRNQTTLVGGVRRACSARGGTMSSARFPLLRYSQEVVLIGGQHWTSPPRRADSPTRPRAAHFKYMAAFPLTRQEVARGQHFGGYAVRRVRPWPGRPTT
ncbi:MAG: hypothetical protein KIS91_09065 [Anaerolineae bacterium]|nr:hypothetical protein [Anaerolineae bacterium]